MSRLFFVNFLTFVRAPLALAASVTSLLCLWFPRAGLVAATLVLLAVSALTDLFDGKLARKWGVVSRLGALADPLMDKVFYVVTLPTATFMAVYLGDIRHAVVLLVLDIVSLARDLWVTFLRAVASGSSAKLGANWYGKVRTALALPVIAFIHLALGLRCLEVAEIITFRVPLPVLYTLEGVLLLVTVLSGLTYTRFYAPQLKESMRSK